MSPLRCPQRTGSFLTLSIPEWSTRFSLFFPLSNPHEGEGNTNFMRLTTTLVSPGGHLVYLGDKSPRVTNTRRSSVKCLLEGWEGHSRGWLKSLLGSLGLSETWGRERPSLSSRSFGSKCLHVNKVSNWAKGAWGSFYSPQGNLAVRVLETRTCPGCGPDISDKSLWNPALAPDISGAGT
jgi:hypothetical protein